MKEKLITFKTAKLAKEKGFEPTCPNIYINGKLSEWFMAKDLNLSDGEYSAPTQTLLKKWLREEYKILVDVGSGFNKYCVEVMTKNLDEKWLDMEYASNEEFEVYEEALEKGLYEALKLIK